MIRSKALKPGNQDIAVCYIRASTEDQKLSPEVQRASLLDWCKRNGKRAVAFFEDLGVSGGAELEKRKGLMSALEALKSEGAGVFLIARRDRLARDVFLAATIERLVSKIGAEIISSDGVGVGDGPEAKLMRQMLDAFAEYERALIRLRIRAAFQRKRVAGTRLGGHVRYGLSVLEDKKHVGENVSELDAIRLIQELHSQGLSLRKVVREMNARGIPCRGKRWHLTTVIRLVERCKVS